VGMTEKSKGMTEGSVGMTEKAEIRGR